MVDGSTMHVQPWYVQCGRPHNIRQMDSLGDVCGSSTMGREPVVDRTLEVVCSFYFGWGKITLPIVAQT